MTRHPHFSRLVSRAQYIRMVYENTVQERPEFAERKLVENQRYIMNELLRTLDECDSYADNADTIETILETTSLIGLRLRVTPLKNSGYVRPPPVDTYDPPAVM